MNAEKKIKMQVEEAFQSSSTYSDIKDRVNCKKPKPSIFNWKLGLGVTLGAVASVALVVVLTNSTSSPVGALAYQLSPTMSREIATAQANSSNLSKTALTAPLLKQKSNEDLNLDDILYDIDSLITNQNSYDVESISSDREEYSNAQKVSYTLLNDESAEYKLYFNDINESSESKGKRNNVEVDYSGIAVSGSVELTFDFVSKEEIRQNRTTYISTTTIYENDSKSDYKVISSESDIKKNKSFESYKYEHYINSTLSDTYTISYDVKKNKTTATVETSTETYTVEKKTTGNSEMFSVHCKNEDGTSNIAYKKVIKDNGSVDYVEDTESTEE